MWFPLALGCAFFSAVSDAFSKQILKTENEYTVVWTKIGGCALLSLPLLLATGWKAPQSGFWSTVLVLVPMDVCGALLYNRALRLSPLYMTIPFLAFTPALLLISSWMILNETPSFLGVLGISLVIAGSTLLHASKRSRSWLAPFRAVLTEPGSRLMLLVAAIFSISASLGRKAVLKSSVLTMSGIYYPMLFGALAPFTAKKVRPALAGLSSKAPWLCALVLSEALAALTHLMAIRQTQAVYMISVKRLSMVFAVVFGWLFFNEKNLGQHLIGASVMAAGTILIAIACS